MDLHNNWIGRKFFADNLQHREANINKLLQMLKLAVKISSIEDIKIVKDELVYIED